MADRKLGRGLEGLMQAATGRPAQDLAHAKGPVSSVPISLLDPNPHQPRQAMKPEDLEHLKSSIREHGVIQPIVVRREAVPRGTGHRPG
jgi:ParB family chromosome partitioning protein